jgi:ATP-binding cassette, subfamily B, bacterial PglK
MYRVIFFLILLNMFKIFKIISGKHRSLLYFSLLLLLFLTTFEILIFAYLQELINYFNQDISRSYFSKILPFAKSGKLIPLLICFLSFFLLRTLVHTLFSFSRSRLVQEVNDDLSQKLFSNYLNNDYIFFLNTNSSKLISNTITEVEKFAYRTIDPLIYLFAEIFIIAGVFVYLTTSYFEATIAMTILIVLFYLIFYRAYRNHFKKMGADKTESDAKKLDDLQKSFYIINEIKIGKLENFFIENFVKNTKKSSASMFKLNFFSDLPKSIIELISLIFIFILLFYAYSELNFNKKEMLAMCGIFVVALFRLLPSANRIYHSLNSIKYHYSSINVIYFELFLKKNSQFLKIENKKIDSKFQSINLKNVSFSYSSNNVVLDGINLNVDRGKLVGIYGKSGGGKTTLLNIICGLINPSTGAVLLNNTENIADFKESYFDLVSHVSQNVFLIDDTVKANVALGNKYPNQEKFLKAMKLSNLSELIDDPACGKENGMLGEFGSKISGGQKQRIGIARALYKETEILILDEPTSALDANSESEILKTINNLKGKITIFLVSHNLNTMNQCDSIYELKDKNIIKIK